MEQTMKGYLFRLLNHEELPRGDEINPDWHHTE